MLSTDIITDSIIAVPLNHHNTYAALHDSLQPK